MGIWEGISNIFRAIGEGLGLVRQRDAEKNAPDVKAAAIGKADTAVADSAAKAVADGDLDAIRKGSAE